MFLIQSITLKSETEIALQTYSTTIFFECYFVRLTQNHNGAVFRTTTRRQRSRSLAFSLSRSADWTEELEKRLRSREERTLDSGGSGEYLMGYKGGSQPICTTRRSSCGQISTCGFQDIFSGQEEKNTIVNILCISCFQGFGRPVSSHQSEARLFAKSAGQIYKIWQISCQTCLFIQSCVLLRQLLESIVSFSVSLRASASLL